MIIKNHKLLTCCWVLVGIVFISLITLIGCTFDGVIDNTSQSQLQQYFERNLIGGPDMLRGKVSIALKPDTLKIKGKTFNGHISLAVEVLILNPDIPLDVTCRLEAGISTVNKSGHLYESTAEASNTPCPVNDQHMKNILDKWLSERESEMKKQYPNLEGTSIYISPNGIVLFAKKK